MLSLINHFTAKILMAAKDRDSIRQISKRIRESYGWTYKWILELEKIGVLKRRNQEIYIDRNSAFYKNFIRLIANSNAAFSLEDDYLLPNLAGHDYIFTSTDAVFIWTKGGYNIARSKDSYPIFIQILENDRKAWTDFFSKFGTNYTFKNERRKGIYFVISTSGFFEKEYCEEMPVLPLNKTVEWARSYAFNFQPALEMLDKMYGLKTGMKYVEV